MASSVNNIAAAFSASRIAVHSSPSFPASPSSAATAAFSSSSATSGSLSLSVAWNPHSSLSRSRFSALLSVYGPPGPPPSSFRPRPSSRRRGIIAVGSRLPSSALSYLANSAVRTTSAAELARGRKAIFLGVPAAFVPRQWYPSKLTAEDLVRRAGEMKIRGAEVVACVSANDVFVMRAWGQSIGASSAGDASGGVMMLSDPDAGMARGMGVAADFTGSAEGFGWRSETYCVVAADGIVKAFFGEDDGVGFDEVIGAI